MVVIKLIKQPNTIYFFYSLKFSGQYTVRIDLFPISGHAMQFPDNPDKFRTVGNPRSYDGVVFGLYLFLYLFVFGIYCISIFVVYFQEKLWVK